MVSLVFNHKHSPYVDRYIAKSSYFIFNKIYLAGESLLAEWQPQIQRNHDPYKAQRGTTKKKSCIILVMLWVPMQHHVLLLRGPLKNKLFSLGNPGRMCAESWKIYFSSLWVVEVPLGKLVCKTVKNTYMIFWRVWFTLLTHQEFAQRWHCCVFQNSSVMRMASFGRETENRQRTTEKQPKQERMKACSRTEPWWRAGWDWGRRKRNGRTWYTEISESKAK